MLAERLLDQSPSDLLQVPVIPQLPGYPARNILNSQHRLVDRALHPRLPKRLRERLVLADVQPAAKGNELVRVERDAVRGVRCEHTPERRPHRARVVDPAERVRLPGERGGVRVEEEDGAPVRGVLCRVLDGPPERVLGIFALADL